MKTTTTKEVKQIIKEAFNIESGKECNFDKSRLQSGNKNKYAFELVGKTLLKRGVIVKKRKREKCN